MARRGVKNFKYGECYAVTWEDHFVHEGGGAWVEQGKIKMEPAHVVSVGFVVEETEKTLALAQSVERPISKEDSVAHVMIIVKSCIVKAQKLKIEELVDEK